MQKIRDNIQFHDIKEKESKDEMQIYQTEDC